MLKQIALLEHKIGDKVFQLVCHSDTTWAELHDVLWKMKEFVLQELNKAHEAQKPKEEKQDEQSTNS